MVQKTPIDWTILLALIAGIILAVMTGWNSQLARHSAPLFASWTAHGVGTLASVALVFLLSLRPRTAIESPPQQHWPIWAYLGGIPGAFKVLLAAITVNSGLGLAGTLAFWLGKWRSVCWRIISDYFASSADNPNFARPSDLL